jgi:hypothetical protein
MWVDAGIQGRRSLVRKEVFDRSERSATSRAMMCLPRSLPTSSPCRRGQRGAPAAQRARTTLTLTSGDPRSAARKALAGQRAQRRPIRAQPNCLDPPKNRRKTGTNHSPAAPAQNLCLRRRNPAQTRAVTHIHAGRPSKHPSAAPDFAGMMPQNRLVIRPCPHDCASVTLSGVRREPSPQARGRR